MGREPRKINPEMPATAISFDKVTLEVLKQVADADDRSLASLVRLAVDSWLKSPEGQKLARKAEFLAAHKGKPTKGTSLERLPMNIKADMGTLDETSVVADVDAKETDSPAYIGDGTSLRPVKREPTKAELLERIEKLEAQAAAKGK